jgi:hypothetical protein
MLFHEDVVSSQNLKGAVLMQKHDVLFESLVLPCGVILRNRIA